MREYLIDVRNGLSYPDFHGCATAPEFHRTSRSAVLGLLTVRSIPDYRRRSSPQSYSTTSFQREVSSSFSLPFQDEISVRKKSKPTRNQQTYENIQNQAQYIIYKTQSPLRTENKPRCIRYPARHPDGHGPLRALRLCVKSARPGELRQPFSVSRRAGARPSRFGRSSDAASCVPPTWGVPRTHPLVDATRRGRRGYIAGRAGRRGQRPFRARSSATRLGGVRTHI